MNKPSVSVIIPAYNRAYCIGEAIDSVLAQTYSPTEIIVVDDGSTDNTKEIIDNFMSPEPRAQSPEQKAKSEACKAQSEERRIEQKNLSTPCALRSMPYIKYIHQPNAGPAAARNAGVREAVGEYVAFLDTDDLWYPFKLEVQVAHIEAHADIIALSTDMDIADTPDDCSHIRANKRIDEGPFRVITLNDLFLRNYMGIVSTSLIKKDPLLAIGGFDETLKMCEDHDLWLRLVQQGVLHKLLVSTALYRPMADGLSAVDRDETTKKNIAFLGHFFNKVPPEFRKKYFSKSMAVNHFHTAIEYTESREYKKALWYLLLSWRYALLCYPEDVGVVFPRLRRLKVILLSWIKNT